MDFTIITPSLNHGKYLAECLASVAAQEGVTLEHLVIDGLSSDESAEVAAGFPHANWISEEDSGMSEAINKGFARAQGDWVMWLNADDFLHPGALAKALDQLKTCNADIAYGDMEFVNKKGRKIRRVNSVTWSMFVHVHHACYVQSTAAFYRRATVIAENFRLRPDFHYVMDGEFYARLATARKTFVHLRLVVASFRLHGGNASQRHLGKPRDMDEAIAAERQHIESRAIRRIHGITLFRDPYLNGLADGFLWIAAAIWKKALKAKERLLP